jgi:hypothetical protein
MTETETCLPAETGGTETTRFNALRHGVLSRYTVLPWEDPGQYGAIVAALAAEHAPQGPTEEHLVEELAGVLWRKRRLRLAEAAAHRQGLNRALAQYSNTAEVALAHLDGSARSEGVAEAIRTTATDTEQELREVRDDEAMVRRALDRLGSRRNDPYEAALAALHDGAREWWADALARDPADLGEGEAPATDDAEGLRRFLEAVALPWLAARQRELATRPLVREQAFGETLNPDKLERLGRYEVHLDRKLERMLSMLLRLKDLRRRAVAG